MEGRRKISLYFDAASAATLASAGKGQDASKLQEEDRCKLRRQALDWVQAALAVLSQQSQSRKVEEVLLVADKLLYWQRDPSLAGVRDTRELAGLPKEERESWKQFWTDQAQLLKEVTARFKRARHQGTLTPKKLEQIYAVSMLAGKSYVVDLESSEFDAYLRVEDGKGKVLLENDDFSSENKNSRVIFSPKHTGVYQIVATSDLKQGTGAYTLTIREFSEP